MNKYLLKKDNTNFIQTGRFKNEIKEIKDIHSIINLNLSQKYFDYDKIPKSIIRMLTNYDFYKIYTIEKIKNKKNEELKIYAPFIHIEHILNLIKKEIKEDNHKDYYNIKDYLENKKKNNYANFWWDLENDYYMFFGQKNEKLILKAQEQTKITNKNIKQIKTKKLIRKYLKNENIKDFENLLKKK